MSSLFFVVPITINNGDVTSLLVAALRTVGELSEQIRFVAPPDSTLGTGHLKKYANKIA